MQEPIKRIILATDFLESSKEAGNRALFLAKAYEAELIALNVLDINDWYFPTHYFYTEEGFDLLAASQAEVRQRRKYALKELTDSFDLDAEAICVEGDPGHEIIRVAEERNADLIVLGTHGHTGWNRFTIGAVVAFVVKHAHCDVFAVRIRAK
jgi:universal stress protein A